MIDPYVYSPRVHRYELAAREIADSHPRILDVGGYRSRADVLNEHFSALDYTSVNLGPAWYGERADVWCDGTRLPFRDSSFPYVICVDTLEHVPKVLRQGIISELVRVASIQAIVVVPILPSGRTDEALILEYSARFEVAPMPSLVEHERYGLPALGELEGYCSAYKHQVVLASPRHLYWSFQLAMLINTAILRERARTLNLELYRGMELALATDLARKREPDQGDAYRAVITITPLFEPASLASQVSESSASE